jgi:hypothetical protein
MSIPPNILPPPTLAYWVSERIPLGQIITLPNQACLVHPDSVPALMAICVQVGVRPVQLHPYVPPEAVHDQPTESEVTR